MVVPVYEGMVLESLDSMVCIVTCVAIDLVVGKMVSDVVFADGEVFGLGVNCSMK